MPAGPLTPKAPPAAPAHHVGQGAPVSWPVSARMAERRARMRVVGARLFATLGIAGAALLDVARDARVPASAAAHGYRRRQDLLFDILYAHIDALHEYVGHADDAAADQPGPDRFRAVVTALLQGIHDHYDAHRVLQAAFPTLPEDRRETLRYTLRTLLHRLATPLEAAVPDLAASRHLRMPLVHSLFGMASHAPSWLRDGGALSRQDYAALIAGAIVAAGRIALAAPRPGG